MPVRARVVCRTDARQETMQRTIFTTPGVNTVLRAVSIGFLKATGWTLDGQAPAGHPKCVLIAAPHTSNWDLPYTLMVAFALRMNIHWMGKRQIFRWPFGALMRWLGGIAVDRSQSTNLVAASAKALRDAEGSVHLVIPPEGTRSQTRHWKTGFYWIAHEAGVPIVLAYMDYPRKLSGLGPVFTPTGDIAADMLQIKAYYAQYKGKNWQQFSAE
jgi:1-acyl-sn-glycerol-3-phosphate acyltransferase